MELSGGGLAPSDDGLIEEGGHLVAELAGFDAGFFGKVFAVGGVDDAARGVDKESTVVDHSVFYDFFEAASLSTYARYEQEAVGRYFSDFFKHFALCGTNDIHHFFGAGPF